MMKIYDDTGAEDMTWAEWVESRAHHVGLTSRKILADAVGISERQLARWLKGKRPPDIHAGNFKKLARALRVHEDTLAQGWRLRTPQEVPVPKPSKNKSTSQSDSEIRRQIQGISLAIGGEALQHLHSVAREIMAAWLAAGESSEDIEIPIDDALDKLQNSHDSNRWEELSKILSDDKE